MLPDARRSFARAPLAKVFAGEDGQFECTLRTQNALGSTDSRVLRELRFARISSTKAMRQTSLRIQSVTKNLYDMGAL
jgi:hypothetical protein